MIDEEWLRGLQFDSPNGRITGLAGIGSQWIAFIFKDGDKDSVLKVPNTPHLGWAIHEVPPRLTTTPLYDVDRLNAKLLRLVDNQLIDGMCEAYNDVYGAVLRILHADGLDGLVKAAQGNADLLQSFAFILHTPGMRRRLEDLALLDLTSHQPGEIVLVNEMSGLIEDTRQNFVTWANGMLTAIERRVPVPANLAPLRLPANPLFAWGAAVLDEFFTDEEISSAVAFITTHFGRLSQRDDGVVLGEQVFALIEVLKRVVEPERARRFVRFCSLAGFRFVDENGNEMPAEHVVPDRPKRSESEALSARAARIPKLAAPSSVTPFTEEGRTDPLGQNEAWRRNARLRIGTFLGEHARAVHSEGIAVSLPRAAVVPDWEWKPWRVAIGVDEDETQAASQEAAATAHDESGDTLTARVLLELLQRCVVCLSAGESSHAEERWLALAETLEDFGYLAICREFDVTTRPRLNALFEVGKIAAHMHGIKAIHGDLHLGDFRFDDRGKLTSMFDLGRTAILDRELTMLERASDLAVLKKHCTFLEWEAAKLGYRSEAPHVADAVFACFLPAGGPEVSL